MKIRINNFLKERPDRFKPAEANKLGLKRLNKIDFSGKIHLSNKKTNTNMILIKPGDLVISGINVEKGAITIYQENEDILATIHYSSYEFDEDKINVEYFKWFLKSKIFKNIVNSQIGGGIKTELKPKKFLPLEIDLPDLDVQKQILSKISSIEKEIKQLEQNVSHDEKLLKKLKQSILSEAVQGKLVSQNPEDEPASELLKKIKKEKEKLIKEGKIKKQKELPQISGDEIPYELPKGWEWCRLGEVCEFINGDRSERYPTEKDFVQKGIPFIRTDNIINDKLDYNFRDFISQDKLDELRGGKLKDKDIIIVLRGSVGKKAIFYSNYGYDTGFINAQLVILRLYFNEILDYSFSYLKSNIAEELIHKDKTGSAQKQLSAENLKNVLLPLPPLPEQKRIVEKVDSLIKLCDELELRIKGNKESSERLMGAVLKESFEN